MLKIKNNLQSPKEIVNNSSRESLIFKKKKSPIKTISYINNDTGKMRHFTPAAQEWFNSVYSYNKDYIKTLPTADKNVMKLLKRNSITLIENIGWIY